MVCIIWPTLLGIAISSVQTWLYNNLATGQGESCDTCKRVQSLPAATRRCSSCRCSGGTGHTASVRAGCQFFDKLIVWLNSNLPRLCAQLSRASYQQKCVHKLTCSLQEEETRGEPAMPMLGQINLSCVCTLTFAANQQRTTCSTSCTRGPTCNDATTFSAPLKHSIEERRRLWVELSWSPSLGVAMQQKPNDATQLVFLIHFCFFSV